VTGHVEQDVTELVSERERCAIGSNSSAIFDDNVSNARTVGVDEGLTDATAPGECRNHEDFDHRWVAVVESFDESALLYGSGGSIDVDEVIESVRQVDATEAGGHRRIGRDTTVRGAIEHGELPVASSDQDIDGVVGPGLDARVLRNLRNEPRQLEGASQRARGGTGCHPRAKLGSNVAPIGPKTNFSATRWQSDVASERDEVRGRRVDDADVRFRLWTKTDATLSPEGVGETELAASQDLRPGLIDAEGQSTADAIAHDEEPKVAA
jgi:hypothetical protein